jgi:serine/threonine-protein kinase
MNREHWVQIKTILAGAIDRRLEERAAFLDSACENDGELRAEVERFLEYEDEAEADRFLDSRASGGFALDADEPVDAHQGMLIGPYRLIREIAHGGMGAVYLAERQDDEFRRTVAIKLLRRAAASADLVRRFRNERQILAAIDHPHIAKLYDGGTTEDGRPFLVMEHIEGKPIDEYCDEKKLSIPERLKLFRKVCAAVQIAHQNLVIHRDVKPANILVTAEGEPKLLDFGIAKLLGPDLSAGTMGSTLLGTHPMTPEYASPEQARGAPVTTASDVYSLGVVLHELLTGRRPYTFPNRDIFEMTRIINEEEPLRPSVAIERSHDRDGPPPRELAARRGGSVDQLRRSLRGDLDNIVMTALRKEPERRYGLVDSLSQDIRRHLERHPVLAHPDTIAYRATRFVQRHHVGVLVATGFLLAVLGFSAFAVRARQRAEDEAAKARAINEFLQRMLGSANVAAGGNQEVTVREALEASVREVGESFREEPALEAAVRDTVGATYMSLGQYDAAERELQTAWNLRRALYGSRNPEVAQSLYRLGVLCFQRGEYGQARAKLGEAAALQRELLGDSHPDLARTLGLLGVTSQEQGEWEISESFYREAIAIYRRRPGGPHSSLGRALSDFAILLHEKGDLAMAESLYREALAFERNLSHPNLLQTLEFFAALLIERGALEEAERNLTEASALLQERIGERSPEAARNLGNWALLRQAQGRYEEAAVGFRESLAIFQSLLGPGHPEVAKARTAYGECLLKLGDLEAGKAQLLEAHAVFSRTLGPEHRQTRRAAEGPVAPR